MRQFIIPACIALAATVCANIYFAPYHTCVRALVDDGSNKADANLYCAKLIRTT